MNNAILIEEVDVLEKLGGEAPIEPVFKGAICGCKACNPRDDEWAVFFCGWGTGE